MEELHIAADKAARQPSTILIPDSSLSNITVPDRLDELWNDVSNESSPDTAHLCRKLLVAHGFLRLWGYRTLTTEDESVVNRLYDWASSIALPSPIFADVSDESSPEGVKTECRKQYTLAIWVVGLLAELLPIQKTANVLSIIFTLASFTSKENAWTTQEAYTASTTVLKRFIAESDRLSFWRTVESILKNQIKPLFAKTKNPSLTAAGRKNFHPIPLPRFDMSILDPEMKPWKVQDVSTITSFTWIVSQYQATDREHLEAHFPLLVPPILTLIDDDSLPFKARGCNLLSTFLIPIRDSKSDILRRTNLSSVFEDAIRPCFHSLPTITPEEDSIHLLGAAYPALRSLLQTSYTSSSTSQKDKNTYLSSTTKTLRDHLIPSFHHISSTNTTTSSSSSSTFASFPHPRLSTLLLTQIATICTDLGIHTTKYLQDIIPLVYSPLSNPFGTAYPPLLLAGTALARAVTLNAHPRIWRWRGELLGAISSCWVHTVEDEEGSEASQGGKEYKSKVTASTSSENEIEGETKATLLKRLKKELQGAVYLLKFALENPALPNEDRGALDAKENISSELRALVEADETLRGCLEAEFDPADPGFFGLSG